MNECSEPDAGRPNTLSTAPIRTVACFELDRFCTGCGYNLRTLTIYRDPSTDIPVVRCPECGRLQPANDASTALRPWLNRTAGAMLGVWILGVLAVILLWGIGEAAISYGTLDELTTYSQIVTQRIGNQTIRTYTGFGSIRVDTDLPHYQEFMVLMITASGLIALAGGVFVVVACPHWRHNGYVGLVLVMPVIAAALVALAWRQEAPDLFRWGLLYIAAHLAVQAVGGRLGIAIGRPLARLIVRIVLPPGIRPRLAYLWMADGKPLPSPIK